MASGLVDVPDTLPAWAPVGTRPRTGRLVAVRLRARPCSAPEGAGPSDRPVPGRGVPVDLVPASPRPGERDLGRCGQAAGIKTSRSLCSSSTVREETRVKPCSSRTSSALSACGRARYVFRWGLPRAFSQQLLPGSASHRGQACSRWAIRSCCAMLTAPSLLPARMTTLRQVAA